MSKRFVALLLLALCLSSGLFAQVLQVVPTTTLTAETANNTSAADTFAAQSNGNSRPGNVSKVAIRSLVNGDTKVFASIMTWFGKSNHMNVGYSSIDPAQIKKQVTDIKSRGYDGVILLWAGPRSTQMDSSVKLFIPELEAQGLKFMVMLEDGSLKFNCSTSPCNYTQETINNFSVIVNNFATSPAYYREAGVAPILQFGLESFSIDWTKVQNSLSGKGASIVTRNAAGFTKSWATGSYAWAPEKIQYPTSGYDYDLDFHTKASQYPTKLEMGNVFKGFNDTLASWSNNRINAQNCGQTWLNSFRRNNDFHSSANPLDIIQVVTWNDYEEGTETETGIDNCVAVTSSVSNQQLSWMLTGAENTLDHFEVFISADGQNLMKLAEAPAGARMLDLSQFPLESGQTFMLHVKAVGKPSFLNRMSDSVAYTTPLVKPSIAVTAATDGTIVKVSASASTVNVGKKITSIIIYVDSVQQYKVAADAANVTFVMPIGTHKITANTWDGSGLVGSVTTTVTSSSPPAVKILQ